MRRNLEHRERAVLRNLAWVTVAAAAVAVAGCGAHVDQLSMSHRHAPDGEARIVVMPIELVKGAASTPEAGETLGSLYATELLKSYEILDFRRFRKLMEAKSLDLEKILDSGGGAAVAKELELDAVLISRVYDWKPGAPGIWFLAKKGRIGFQARLVDLRTGSVIWSANRVRETEPSDPLPVGLAHVFRDLAAEMPSQLTSF
jgi:hypothetical protein